MLGFLKAQLMEKAIKFGNIAILPNILFKKRTEFCVWLGIYEFSSVFLVKTRGLWLIVQVKIILVVYCSRICVWAIFFFAHSYDFWQIEILAHYR